MRQQPYSAIGAEEAAVHLDAALQSRLDARVLAQILDQGVDVDDAGFGSLAYAVSELKVPLIVVLGHEKCGAVAAANAVLNDSAKLPPSLLRMVQPLLPASIEARTASAPAVDLLDRTIHLNVKRVADGLRQTRDPLLADPIAKRSLRVVGAYYDLDTGAVDFFDT